MGCRLCGRTESDMTEVTYRSIDTMSLPGGSDDKEIAFNAGDLGSVSGSGRSPAEGNGNTLQCSCLGNPLDRGDWRATGYGVANELDMT